MLITPATDEGAAAGCDPTTSAADAGWGNMIGVVLPLGPVLESNLARASVVETPLEPPSALDPRLSPLALNPPEVLMNCQAQEQAPNQDWVL